MREVKLDPNWEIPTVEVVISGSQKRTVRANLVFDTGSGLTQLDIDLVERLGYAARDAVSLRKVKGPIGDAMEGYVVKLAKLALFGKTLSDIPTLTYDFKNFPGLDGLLGWDVIRGLHIELNGPSGVLKVF